MTLFVESPFNVGDKVMNRKYRKGRIIDIELKRAGAHCVIYCLVEFDNRERVWVNEFDLAKAAED